jgi:hypothetical protein
MRKAARPKGIKDGCVCPTRASAWRADGQQAYLEQLLLFGFAPTACKPRFGL